jgi:hypothetical protein
MNAMSNLFQAESPDQVLLPVSSKKFLFGTILGLFVLVASVATVAYQFGARQPRLSSLSDAVLHATATHGGTNVAVATGAVGDDAEGVFILDYLTGNLQCWVFSPRYGQFGGKFETNIGAQLPLTKNAEYLLVTASTNTPSTSGNARPAPTICYVVDPKSGVFAGYTFPWNRSMELGGQVQKAPMICIGGDQFRQAAGGASAKKPLPTPTKDADKAKAPATK